jgi:ABC-2 type transport system permease protein
MRRLLHIMRKELIELRQDPKLFGVLFIAPIVQLVVLGYAATTDVKNVPIVIADGDRSSMSRQLIAQFEGSPYFTVAGTVTTMREIDDWLEQGRAWIAVGIPADYHRSIGSRRPAVVQVIADGTDSNSTSAAMNYAQQLIAQYGAELAAKRAGLAALPEPAIESRIRVWFNPQLESRTFMIPGIVAMLLLVITTNLSSMALVRERELGTLEQLNVTPLARWQLILGKLLPYGLLGMGDVVLVVVVALVWFRIPLLGSPLLLFACCLIYLLTTLGLGLFISTVSETQQQSMMTATFFFLTPMLYLSGFIFPIENMPVVIQKITYLVPLRYFIIIVRGIFLKGVGVAVLWPEILALLAWGLAITGLAVLRSRKTTA